jgi:hypothetical protein
MERDWCLWIADVEVTEGEADDLARRILGWLVAREIVRPDRTDCVLGDVDGGYAPGPGYAAVVKEPDDGFHAQWANGLEIDIGRTVFYGQVSETDRFTCPRCAAWLPIEVVVEASEEWADGGPSGLRCLGCGATIDLNEWTWDSPWAFAMLGFRFWNWPRLTDDFLADFADRLGHRTVSGITEH